MPKYLRAIAADSPIVPQPKTTAFWPCFSWPRLVALQPTVNGSIKQAILSEIVSSTGYKEIFLLALGIRIYSEKPPIVPARFVLPLAYLGYG